MDFAYNVQRVSIVDPETGDLSFSYTCKNGSCITELIDTGIAKKYVAYDLIRHDLVCAKEWIELAYKILPPRGDNKSTASTDRYGPKEDREKENIIMSLFISSVTYYGKCFAQAKGRGVKLDKVFVPNEFHTKHDQIIQFRHTVAAHSGNGPWDTGVLKLIKTTDNDPFIWSELKMLSFCDDSDEKQTYLDLLCAITEKVRQKMGKLSKCILKEIHES